MKTKHREAGGERGVEGRVEEVEEGEKGGDGAETRGT
jgi:hypothetical protein